MEIQKSNFLSIEQVKDQYLNQPKATSEPIPKISFNDILKAKTEFERPNEVKFSKHAANRLVDRNISLSSEQMERLNGAARKASEKGIRESLVLVDSLAFIVNVPNNIVVTALDQQEAVDNVFTNIDGAVIV